jgi:hypothetical protein
VVAAAALALAPLGALGAASYDPSEDERDPGVGVVGEILVGLHGQSGV